ncbi:hypothetical protein THOM_1273 [Trachipleistophora hominis]|uniref:Spc7 kinetochore protein domain-containing protein n=1 Tax=Trachipleistophora hominis TaxID=72359 RepID=L7JWS1_TRAHO|nr:hypothetical protein THOM_1273 [Trachipleistophora hominis]
MPKNKSPSPKPRRVSFAKKSSIIYIKNEDIGSTSPHNMSIDGGEVSVEITNDYGGYVDGDGKEVGKEVNVKRTSSNRRTSTGKRTSTDKRKLSTGPEASKVATRSDTDQITPKKNQYAALNTVYAHESNNLNGNDSFYACVGENVEDGMQFIGRENVLNTGVAHENAGINDHEDVFMNVRIENVIEETKDKNLIEKEEAVREEELSVGSELRKTRGVFKDTDELINANELKSAKDERNEKENEINLKNKIINDNAPIDEPNEQNSQNEQNGQNEQTKDILINTVDLRKIIRKDDTDLNINERLASIGIRFLDDLMLKQTRKSTLLKTKNTVDDRLYLYYKLYYEQRMAFFVSFLSYIERKMKEHEQLLASKHKEMRAEDFMRIKNAKALKTECRNRTKIRWHELRRTRENVFNARMVECRDGLVEWNRGMEVERERRERERARVRGEIEGLEMRMGQHKGKHGNVDGIVIDDGSNDKGSSNGSNNYSTTTKCNTINSNATNTTNATTLNAYDFTRMKHKIKEQNDLIECLTKEIEAKKNSNAVLKQNIKNEKAEEQALRVTIREMEENARTKTVDEHECERMRKKYLLSAMFYQCEVLKVERDEIEFKFLQFRVVYGDGGVVVSGTVKNEFINFYLRVVNEMVNDCVRGSDCVKDRGSKVIEGSASTNVVSNGNENVSTNLVSNGNDSNTVKDNVNNTKNNSNTNNNYINNNNSNTKSVVTVHPSLVINFLSLISLYYEEILVIERKYFLDMVINDDVHLNVRVPSISNDERDVEILIDKELVMYVKREGEYVKSRSISLLDVIEG